MDQRQRGTQMQKLRLRPRTGCETIYESSPKIGESYPGWKLALKKNVLASESS